MIRRKLVPILTLTVVAAMCLSPAAAQLLSKRYEFKPGVILEIALPVARGLRLETVHFEMPATVDGRITLTSGLARAHVTISNTATESRKAGIGLALFDGQDRMLAVAGGGSGLRSIKPGGRRTFTLVFDGVYAEAHKAETFQISVESKS